MKREKLLCFVLISFIIFSGFLSSQSCNSDQVMFSLFSERNSHVGSSSNSDYSVKACYNSFFGSEGNGERVCPEGSSPLFYKYAMENSHVATSSEEATIPVCYGGLKCRAVEGECTGEEKLIASLSASENAHISLGDDPEYPVKICCSSSSFVRAFSGELVEDSAKWISSKGEDISSTGNNTLVNLSFQGNFSKGAVLNYKIFLKDATCRSLFGIPLSCDDKIVSNGIYTIDSNDLLPGEEYTGIKTFSSIQFRALWEESARRNDAPHFFEISYGDEKIESGELTIDRGLPSGDPLSVKITSPVDRQIYFVGENIPLSWKVVSGRDVNNITYVSDDSTASFSGGKSGEISASGGQELLLELSINVSFSKAGNKKITLTAIDDSGTTASSSVSISIAGNSGVNVFPYISNPGDLEEVNVGNAKLDSKNYLVFFNGSGSYIYNVSTVKSSKKIHCLFGDCPKETSGKLKIEIGRSLLTQDRLKLNSSDLIFNWTWKDSLDSVSGSGDKEGIVFFNRYVKFAGDSVVSLNLSFKKDSESSYSRYFIIFNEGKHCLDNVDGWTQYFKDGYSKIVRPYDLEKGCCCSEGKTCVPEKSEDATCNVTVYTETFCSDLKSRDSCESDLRKNYDLANAVYRNCGDTSSKGGEICSYSCGCVWNETDNRCDSYRKESCVSPSDSNTNSDSDNPKGNCLITTTTDGSCSDASSFITYSSESVYSWPLNVDDTHKLKYKSSEEECRSLTGTWTVSCPARLKIPFFGAVELIVSIIIIALLYLFLRDFFKKSEKKKSPAKKKTKSKK